MNRNQGTKVSIFLLLLHLVSLSDAAGATCSFQQGTTSVVAYCEDGCCDTQCCTSSSSSAVDATLILVVVGVVVGVVVVAFVALAIFCYLRDRKKTTDKEEHVELSEASRSPSEDVEGRPALQPANAVVLATNRSRSQSTPLATSVSQNARSTNMKSAMSDRRRTYNGEDLSNTHLSWDSTSILRQREDFTSSRRRSDVTSFGATSDSRRHSEITSSGTTSGSRGHQSDVTSGSGHDQNEASGLSPPQEATASCNMVVEDVVESPTGLNAVSPPCTPNRHVSHSNTRHSAGSRSGKFRPSDSFLPELEDIDESTL